jgi:YbgC/YbaW family acyl-CoA thioester hydrolase
MHTTELIGRFHELDAYGHLNHAVYLHYLESARVEALATVGLGLDRLAKDGFHLLVVDVRARFHRPAVLGDVLTVETEITDLRQVTCRWTQRILRRGEPIVSAELRGAITNLDGHPTRAPAELVSGLAPLRSLAAG